MEEYKYDTISANREIIMWRVRFLNELLCGDLSAVSEENKNKISLHFLSIPSDKFTDPVQELHKCISLVL